MNFGVCEVAWCQGIFAALGNTLGDKNHQIYGKNRWSPAVKPFRKHFYSGAPDNFSNSSPQTKPTPGNKQTSPRRDQRED